MKLEKEACELFVNALLNSPEPNAAAKIAATEYKEKLGAKSEADFAPGKAGGLDVERI